MPDPHRFICIGKLGAPHGVRGWVKVTTYTQNPADLFTYSPWYIQRQGSYLELTAVESARQNNYFLVKPPDCDDRDTAQTFTNLDIFVKRSQLPPISEHDYYWSDLEGLAVHNADGATLGAVDHLFETGANPVMVVVGKKRHLIPFLKGSVIQRVCFDTYSMQVDWPENF